MKTVRDDITAIVQPGDYIIWDDQNIAVVQAGRAGYPLANITVNPYSRTVSLLHRSIELDVPDTDGTPVLITRARVVSVAKAFARRLRGTSGFTPQDYWAADELLKEGEEVPIEANRLFRMPVDDALFVLFDEVFEQMYSDDEPNTEELKRVAFAAIFSVYKED